jgi:hypothetical protein
MGAHYTPEPIREGALNAFIRLAPKESLSQEALREAFQLVMEGHLPPVKVVEHRESSDPHPMYHD